MQIRVLSEERSELRCGISKELEAKINRIREIESKRLGRLCTLEEALSAMASSYQQKNDPIVKADRVFSSRRKSKASLKTQVAHRDRGQCTYTAPTGTRCQAKTFTQIHHITPKSEGGQDTLPNLTTLCTAHHQHHHRYTSQVGAAFPLKHPDPPPPYQRVLTLRR